MRLLLEMGLAPTVVGWLDTSGHCAATEVIRDGQCLGIMRMPSCPTGRLLIVTQHMLQSNIPPYYYYRILLVSCQSPFVAKRKHGRAISCRSIPL
jgi:hypothetical protein